MEKNLEHKVDSVNKVEHVIKTTVAVLLVAAFCFLLPMMVDGLFLFGMLALCVFLTAVLLVIFYFAVYINYQVFIETTANWANDTHFTGREVISLSYERFSTFYTLSPKKWELSDLSCIYMPTSGESFAVVFSFLDYLRYTHHELKQQLKTEQELKSEKNKEHDIKSLEQFAKYIKEDLASFEQENPLNILVEKCRKEDGHV